MRRTLLALAALLLIADGTSAAEPDAPAEPTVQFDRDVAPILRRHCYRCHAGKQVEASLHLDRTIRPGDVSDSDEALLTPHKPADSLLWTRITDPDAGDLMPLDGEPLKARDRKILRTWIEEGANWPDRSAPDVHWAYVPPTRPELPNVWKDASPIDLFIEARLKSERLAPNGPEQASKLLRRLSLALTGLPPTPADYERFTKDPSRAAYEREVDRLLNSLHFGEHWARPWLDLARYADSNGFQADQLRDSWAYRDYVIDAFNSNMPLDRFIVEQLAGDLLPDATLQQKIATGFHRTVTCNVKAGVHPEENRVNQIFDRVNTTGTVFLGTTLECAQCHDHKYDPFSQEEYYQLFAFFNNTPLEVENKSGKGVQFEFYGPKMDLPLAEDEQTTYDKLTARLHAIEKLRESILESSDERFADWLVDVRTALTENPARYVPASIATFESTGDEKIRTLVDGSVLLTGPVPNTATYTVTLAADGNVWQGVKLETLTHPELPGTGPGRGDKVRRNVILSELTAHEVNAAGNTTADAVPLTDPTADFSQKGWPVANALDGDLKTGWAFSPKFGEDHWMSVRFLDGVDSEAAGGLRLRLVQNYGQGRVIGRLRVSVLVGDPRTSNIPDDIRPLLTKEKLTNAERKQLQAHYRSELPELAKLDQEAAGIKKSLAGLKPPTTLVMVEMQQPRETHVLNRGEYLNPGKPVTAGVPELLRSSEETLTPSRLGLAEWIVGDENPLTARVMVNRFWMELFGNGLVRTPEDFGTQGELPTHPELLDWLAVELVESGWDFKGLLRQIVLTDAFRRSAAVTSALRDRDPENRLLARGPRFRLSAEAIRDHALAVSGLLESELHGPPVMPYQPPRIWRSVGRNQPKWITATDADRYRRGLYVVWKRAAPYPSFVTFDAPDRAACTVQRSRTNTPLQALALLNDPAYAEMAVAFAQRVLSEHPKANTNERLTYAFRLATGREPSSREIEILRRLLKTEQQLIKQTPTIADERAALLLKSRRNESVSTSDLGAWTAVANALLNLDETISL